MSTEQGDAYDWVTRYRHTHGNRDSTGKVVTVTPDTECASCSQVHRFRMHAGRNLTCLMASCNCTGFVAKAEEVEAQSD